MWEGKTGVRHALTYPTKLVSSGFGLCCNHLITFLALQKFCSSTLYVAFRCPLREVGRKKTIYVFNTEVI